MGWAGLDWPTGSAGLGWLGGGLARTSPGGGKWVVLGSYRLPYQRWQAANWHYCRLQTANSRTAKTAKDCGTAGLHSMPHSLVAPGGLADLRPDIEDQFINLAAMCP